MVRFAHAHTQSQSHEQTQHLNMANSLSVRPHITKQYFARLGMHILQKKLEILDGRFSGSGYSKSKHIK